MTSQIVAVSEIQTLSGKTFTPAETARVQMDLDALTESLEGWCRRKFVQTFIANERHTLNPSGVFLNWGDPFGDVDVRYNSLLNPIYTYSADSFRQTTSMAYSAHNTVAYVSYTTDVSVINNFRAALKSLIIDAVLFKALAPDAVRYGIITSYSVEGLSVSYGSGNAGRDSDVGGIANFNLKSIAPLRRNVIL